MCPEGWRSIIIIYKTVAHKLSSFLTLYWWQRKNLLAEKAFRFYSPAREQRREALALNVPFRWTVEGLGFWRTKCRVRKECLHVPGRTPDTQAGFKHMSSYNTHTQMSGDSLLGEIILALKATWGTCSCCSGLQGLISLWYLIRGQEVLCHAGTSSFFK